MSSRLAVCQAISARLNVRKLPTAIVGDLKCARSLVYKVKKLKEKNGGNLQHAFKARMKTVLTPMVRACSRITYVRSSCLVWHLSSKQTSVVGVVVLLLRVPAYYVHHHFGAVPPIYLAAGVFKILFGPRLKVFSILFPVFKKLSESLELSSFLPPPLSFRAVVVTVAVVVVVVLS